MIIPETLRPGSCIGIFSPAGPVRDPVKVEAGIDLLQKMGFRVKPAALPGTENGYLAAGDHHRLEEFQAMLLDREVDALMALRGGFGCLRIAGLLDYDLIGTCRKFIIGFSDVSILLNAINSRSGIVTVHGPVLTSLAGSDQVSVKSLHTLLTAGLPQVIASEDTVVLRPGEADGVLRGGNLTTIVHLLGTPWEIPWTKTILLLEDTAEPMYKIDRMLTQLHLSGRLDQLAGIILGDFDLSDDPEENLLLQQQVWQRVEELTANSGCPVWGNFPIGHRARNVAVPLGLKIFMKNGPERILFDKKS